MKKLILASMLCLAPTLAAGGTLTVSGKSYSLMLNDAVVYMGGNQVRFYFTTYDGNRYTYPYYYDATKQMIYRNYELKKLGNTYYTDYYCVRNGMISDIGEISFTLGSIDSDNNGIDDICEINKSVNVTVTGNWYSIDGSSGAISGTMIKNSGSQQGYYSLFVKGTFAGDIPATGDFYSGILSGDASYSRMNYSITINYTITYSEQGASNQLQTFYEVIDSDTVKIIGRDEVPTTILVRYGNNYYATVELSDGNLGTFWPDYQKWYYVITDNNDIDRDGIPDLSDKEDNRKKVNLPFLPLVLE